MPSNSKINPQTPSRTEIENLIKYLKLWSRTDRERTVRYFWQGNQHTYGHIRRRYTFGPTLAMSHFPFFPPLQRTSCVMGLK